MQHRLKLKGEGKKERKELRQYKLKILENLNLSIENKIWCVLLLYLRLWNPFLYILSTPTHICVSVLCMLENEKLKKKKLKNIDLDQG